MKIKQVFSNQFVATIFFKCLGGFVIHLEDDTPAITDSDRSRELFYPIMFVHMAPIINYLLEIEVGIRRHIQRRPDNLHIWQVIHDAHVTSQRVYGSRSNPMDR